MAKFDHTYSEPCPNDCGFVTSHVSTFFDDSQGIPVEVHHCTHCNENFEVGVYDVDAI